MTRLATPPVPRIVPDGVFDAFAWCASDAIDWGHAGAIETATPVTSANPAKMVFVLRAECTFLPKERAALHVGELGIGELGEEEWALAPWGIDDATDLLWEHRARPGDLLWLAAGALDGLFWGLHDWAHFHNHGPFEQRAWTELQCDASALAWAWLNSAAIGIDEATWERVRREVIGVGAARFAEEGLAFDEAWLAADRVRGLF